MSRAGGLDIVGAVGFRVVPILDEDAMRAIAAQIKQQTEARAGTVAGASASTNDAAQSIAQAQITTQTAASQNILANQEVTQAAIRSEKRGPMLTRASVGKEIRSLIGDEISLEEDLITQRLAPYTDPFGWPGEFPGEVRRHKEGAAFATQRLLRQNVVGGQGPDAFADLGEELFSMADYLGASAGKKASLAAMKSHNPYARFLGQLYGEIGSDGGIETTKIDPSALKSGHSFTIAGHQFPVDEDEYGQPVIRGSSKFDDLPISAIPGKLSVDKGSLRFSAPQTFSSGDDIFEGLDTTSVMKVDTSAARAEVQALRTEIEQTKAAAENAMILHPVARSKSPLEVTHVGAMPEASGRSVGTGYTPESIAAIYAENQRQQELRAMGYDPKIISEAEHRVRNLKDFESQMGDSKDKFANQIRGALAQNVAELGFDPSQFDERGKFRTPTADSPLITPAPPESRFIESRVVPTVLDESDLVDGTTRRPSSGGGGRPPLPPINTIMGGPNDPRWRQAARKGDGVRQQRTLADEFFGKVSGTGLMMSGMFGGWEVAQAVQAAARMENAMGTPSEIAQQQLAAVQQMRSGVLGSIAGLIVDPFDSTSAHAMGMIASAEAGERFGAMGFEMHSQARELRQTQYLMSAPDAAQGILGLYNKERVDVGAMRKSMEDEAKALARQEAQAELSISKSLFAGRRAFASFMGGIVGAASGYEDGVAVRSDFDQWLGWSDEELRVQRWGQDNQDRRMKIIRPRIAELTGAMQGLTDEQAASIVRDINQNSQLDISGLGVNSAAAQSIANVRKPINELWASIDESMKRGGPERERDRMREAIWAQTPTANFIEDMAKSDQQFEKDVKDFGSFEARDRQLAKQEDIWRTYLDADSRADELPGLLADIGVDRQSNRTAQRRESAFNEIQLQSIRASASADQFDDQWVSIAPEAEAAALIGIDDPVQQRMLKAWYGTQRAAFGTRKDRFNRQSMRSLDQQIAMIEAGMTGRSDVVDAEQIALSAEADIADFLEAGQTDRAEKRREVAKRQLEYSRQQFHQPFQAFTGSAAYAGFAQEGSGGGAFDDAERRINEAGKETASKVEESNQHVSQIPGLIQQLIEVVQNLV